jgi:hypothetical protein
VRTSYEDVIDYELGVVLMVEFESVGRDVVDYSVVLRRDDVNGAETIRVYDSAHGFNEMHRFTRRGGKQRGLAAHPGTLGEGMRGAIEEIKSGYRAMMAGWEG